MPSVATVMLVAGERSGDLYGAELARELKARVSRIDLFGCGGEAMREAGVETVVDAHEFAMVGITEVISGLRRAHHLFHRLLDEADGRRPQLAVLIDSPSLNLRLAKRLKPRGVRVCYFVSPQVWAWKKWRMRHLQRRVDKMLCIFDFEEALYRRAGVDVEYVGHPLVDLLDRHSPGLTRGEFRARFALDPAAPLVALLPGSRKVEIQFNLPAMLAAARLLAGERRAQFVLAAAPELDLEWLASEIRRASSSGGPAAGSGPVEGSVGGPAPRVVSGLTYEALRYSEVAVVASGTATLEAALLERPMVVVYRIAPVTAMLARLMVDVPFYSIVNLLAGKRVVPELIQKEFTGGRLADELCRLLDDAETRRAMVDEFRGIRARLRGQGAASRAADAVVRMLESGGPSGASAKG